MTWKAVVVALLATTAFVAPGHDTAAALFSVPGSGAGRAASEAVPQLSAPIAVAVGRDMTVSWSAASLSGGTPVAGYVVRRYDLAGVAQTVLSACSAVTSATCVEHNVPVGTWKYTVQPVIGSWSGPESAKSAATTVSTAGLTVTSAMPISTLPATVTGTVTNFGVGATLTYRLDSSSGTVLSGTPTTVTSNSMGISVTIPAGTSDAPHSVFVVDSLGTSASAAIDIVMPPVVQTMQMRDVDANGKVDQVLVTFNEALASYSAGLTPWTLANVPSGGSLASVSVSGSTATLSLAEGAGAATTAVGSFTVALAANASGIRDVNNHPASFTAQAPTDAAPHAVQSLTALDTNANGRIDRVTMSFSEAMAAYTAGTTPWSLVDVPSGGTLSSVAVTSPNVTITITEGAGAADTAVGAFTVSLAASGTGIRDAAGNLASFSRTPADGAVPLRQAQEMFDDDVDGRVDRVRVTFSEPLAPFTASPGVFTLASAPSGATVLAVTTTGSQANVALDEGAGAASTAVGSFTVALASAPGGIRDAAGNLASYAAATVTDRAAPALVTLTMLDNNGNGKVDRVTALFSETLQTYSAGTTPWTLANVPSGGTLSSVSLSSATFTLTLVEGAGAADTGVGAMTVAMASSAAGARDATGNLGSFVARAPGDGARPVAMSIADTNGSVNGQAQPGDTVSITFSEPLAPASVPSATTLTLADPVGAGNDTLTMAGVSNGARTTGANNYVTIDGGVASFAGSLVTLSNGNATITVTIGAACSGTGCSSLGTQTGNGTYSFVAATTLQDVAGNAPVTTTRTQSMRLF